MPRKIVRDREFRRFCPSIDSIDPKQRRSNERVSVVEKSAVRTKSCMFRHARTTEEHTAIERVRYRKENEFGSDRKKKDRFIRYLLQVRSCSMCGEGPRITCLGNARKSLAASGTNSITGS